MKKLDKLRPSVKLSIVNPRSDSRSVFGRGIAQLCEGIREKGSLNAAAKGLKMAYSKAWRIMKETEVALGVQLLIRNGAHGSTLTKEGEALLEAYVKLEERVAEVAEESFTELFPK